MSIEITRTETKKNVVELRDAINKQGAKVVHIIIDGMTVGVMGYTSEKDKEAALKVLQTAIDSSENTMEALMKINTIANFTDKEVNPTEEIVVDDVTYYIDYEKKTAYDEVAEEVVDCTDLECDVPEAIKAILIERIKNYHLENCDDDYYEEY